MVQLKEMPLLHTHADVLTIYVPNSISVWCTHTQYPIKSCRLRSPSFVGPYCPGYYPGYCYRELVCLSMPVD